MAERGDTRKGDPVLRIVPGGNEAAGKHDIGCLDIELAGRDTRQPGRDPFGRESCRTGDRGCKTGGIVARRDGPRVLGGIDFGVDADVLRHESEHIGDDLGEDGAMALPLRD
jgi:hypothetical protein